MTIASGGVLTNSGYIDIYGAVNVESGGSMSSDNDVYSSPQDRSLPASRRTSLAIIPGLLPFDERFS